MIRLLIVTATIVLVAILVDSFLIYHQATVGKLPWKIKLMPDLHL